MSWKTTSGNCSRRCRSARLPLVAIDMRGLGNRPQTYFRWTHSGNPQIMEIPQDQRKQECWCKNSQSRNLAIQLWELDVMIDLERYRMHLSWFVAIALVVIYSLLAIGCLTSGR